MQQVCFNYFSYNDCLKKLSALTDLSLSCDRSFVANNPPAENVCSASNDVGGMVNKALNNCSNFLGIFSWLGLVWFSVASSSFIFCLITV